MDKSKRSQILKLSLIASLFIITPLIPAMFKSTYLYFIFNLLVVALVAEAGLVSFFSKSTEDDKKHANTTISNLYVNAGDSIIISKNKEIIKPKIVEKCSFVKVTSKIKKSPSTPSIFFIGNGENEPEVTIEEEDEVISGQELFTKAEIFIGNFYKQLKMQREDSWNKIHGFIKKPFEHFN